MSLFRSTSCSLIQFPPASVIDALLTQPLTAAGGGFYPQGLMLSILPRRCLEVEKFTMKIYQMIFFFLKGMQGGDV